MYVYRYIELRLAQPLALTFVCSVSPCHPHVQSGSATPVVSRLRIVSTLSVSLGLWSSVSPPA